jgi:hypothetical protein
MVDAFCFELVLDLADLEGDLVDEAEGRLDVAEPRFGELEAAKEPPSLEAGQVRDRAGWPKARRLAWMRFFNAVL